MTEEATSADGELEVRKPEQRFYRITIERRFETGSTPETIAAVVECWAWDYYDALKTVLSYLVNHPPEPRRDGKPIIHRVARHIQAKAMGWKPPETGLIGRPHQIP